MPLGTGMFFYTKGPSSKQASFVFPRRANWLESRRVAVVNSAERGLRKERKLESGSVQRSPSSGLGSAKVLNSLFKCFSVFKPTNSAAVSAPQSTSSFTRWSSSKRRTFAGSQSISSMGEGNVNSMSRQASSKLFRTISHLSAKCCDSDPSMLTKVGRKRTK